MSIINFFSYKDVLNDVYRKQDGHYMSDLELKELQETLVSILSDIMRACDKYNIKPFLQGGTLLGKVRHDGFIPWDDDLDMGMFRDDYEKFKKIFDKELSDNYILKGPGCPDGATNRFIQIFKKNTCFETFDDPEDRPKMIYIDIFPIDYVSDFVCERKIKGCISNVLMFIASCVECNYHFNDNTKELMKSDFRMQMNMSIRLLVGKIFSFHSMNKWFEIVDCFIRRNRKSSYVTSATGRKHYLGEIVDNKVFFPLKRTNYCGVDTWTLNKPEEYLENLYGESYMIVPDEAKREHHFIKKMKTSIL